MVMRFTTIRMMGGFLTVLAVAVTLSGCSEVVGLSSELDIGEIVLPREVRYVCDGWVPAEPEQEFGLFDVIWGGEGPARRSHREQIRQAGGEVVHSFQLPKVRAILPVHRVPELNAYQVRGVPDVEDLSVGVGLLLRSEVTEEDLAWITSLGGEILRVLRTVPIVQATVPDARIPEIRAHGRVEDVSLSGAGACPG